MRRPMFVAVLAGSLLVACAEQPTEAPSSPPTAAPSLDVGPPACSLNSLLDLAKALFPPSPTLNTIVTILKSLPTKPQLRLAAAIRATVFGIVDVVTKAYKAGKLAGGQSAATQANLFAFLNGLYCFVGLVPNIPLGALDPNEGAIVVITPNSGNTLVRPNSKHGGIFIPAASAPTITTVTVSILPNSPGPLLTSLDQYPLFYEFNSSPAVTFNKFLTTAVCLSDAFTLGQPRLAHNVGTAFGNVEVLPVASPSGVVDCTNISPTIGSRWGVRGLFASVFLPAELHATTTALVTSGVGGTTKKFSPFGAVDAASNPGTVDVESGVPTNVFTAPGETVSPSPAVVVRSKNGTPIKNVPVTFEVGENGGTVNGGLSQTVNTDANGIATATNWLPGSEPGDYTLTASAPSIGASGTVEPYRPAVAFNPASQTFTATVVGTLGYEAGGYRFLQSSGFEGSFPPAGFQGVGFDDSGWGVGGAGFGHDGGNNCSLISNNTATDWPVNSQILLRKRFTLSGGGSTGRVRVAIDNDIKVFVNGADITFTGVAETPLDGDGFLRYEGCPARGSFTFTATGLSPGVNLLVIQARDRGGSSYVDVSVDPPAE